MAHTFTSGTRSSQSTRETFLPPEKITAFENLNKTLDDPFSGTGITNIIQTLLQSLLPGEELSRRSQADEFRKSGGLSDASRAVASSRLESGFQRNRSETAARGFLAFLGPILQGRSNALSGIPALSRGQTSSSAETFRQGQHAGAPTSGGGGGGAPGTPSEGLNRGGGDLRPDPSLDAFARFSTGATGFGPGAGAVPTISGQDNRFANFTPQAPSDGLVRTDGQVVGISPNASQSQFDNFVQQNFLS